MNRYLRIASLLANFDLGCGHDESVLGESPQHCVEYQRTLRACHVKIGAPSSASEAISQLPLGGSASRDDLDARCEAANRRLAQACDQEVP